MESKLEFFRGSLSYLDTWRCVILVDSSSFTGKISVKTLHAFVEEVSEDSPSNAKIIVEHLYLEFDGKNAGFVDVWINDDQWL